jgi:MATE family multidrug resistance protein
MRQALWLSVLLSGPTIWLLCQMATVMRWLRVTPDVVHIAQGYLDALAWGVFPAFAFSALRFLCEGIGFTRPIMLFGIVGLVTNVGANYVLIYGKLGFPALGAVGCGLASALALWAMFGCLLAHVLRFHRYRRLGIFARMDYPEWSELKPLLTIGLPIGLTIFIEASIFGAIALILGVLGATVVAGHQIALNVASLSFMIPLSFAMATTVRVGQAAGRSDPRAARTCGFIGIAMALVTQMAMGLLIFTFAQPIAKLYSNDPSVIDVAVGLLTIQSFF